jgi:AcrR family transcriptional regulator
MGRRSDHSREELEELILVQGHALMAEAGYARFSAREVAKRVGYSIGTIYHVVGSLDVLVLAINSRTFVLWADWLREKLAAAGDDRIAALVAGYFDFAERNPNLWTAIYDHRQPPGTEMPEGYRRLRGGLTRIVETEIALVLPADRRSAAPALARSLVALVHGHCEFALNGAFALLGEERPQAAALARVREALAAGGATGAAIGCP